MVQVNLTGTFLCTREAFRIMKTQQPIRIQSVGTKQFLICRTDQDAVTGYYCGRADRKELFIQSTSAWWGLVGGTRIK